jgi:hypothetical protein
MVLEDMRRIITHREGRLHQFCAAAEMPTAVRPWRMSTTWPERSGRLCLALPEMGVTRRRRSIRFASVSKWWLWHKFSVWFINPTDRESACARSVSNLSISGAAMIRKNGESIRNRTFAIAMTICALCGCGAAPAQTTKTQYPAMAPIQDYLMERSAEIALARTAAPPSISGDAEVIVLTSHGFESAAKGTNGFVCVVLRSWSADTDDPVFWNPKVRGPACLNAAAAKSQIPILQLRTKSVFASQSKEQMLQELKAGFEKKELLEPEAGSMCYMLSPQGYLNDSAGYWHPHLMFYLPLADPAEWGANLDGSPSIGFKDPADHLTLYMVPVGRWSDGSVAPPM